MSYNRISWYQFTEIENPEELHQELKKACTTYHLLGRILIGNEGINGAVCGEKTNIEKYKEYLQVHFPQITFREQQCQKNVFHKLVVRIRAEIVVLGQPVNMANRGKHISPQKLKEWYDENKDFVIFDMRNAYEYDVGHFTKAIKVPTKTFKEVPHMINQLMHYKDKTIVMYCTEGIRCEKASAYYKEQGFSDVYQLEGGVTHFITEYPHGYWKGGLFMFDDRLVIPIASPITTCHYCPKPSEKYYNCYNLACDKLFIACDICIKNHHNCCSPTCEQAPQKRNIPQQRILLGKVKNYYPQAHVALIETQNTIEQGTHIEIWGKITQSVTQIIQELRSDEGQRITHAQKGMFITFPCNEKVRKNDFVFLSEKLP